MSAAECTCECRCCSCCDDVEGARAEAKNNGRERDEARRLLAVYEEALDDEQRTNTLVALLAVVGTVAVLVALVCLAVLALRLAGGAS